jgi:hypothetical protein
MVDVGKVKKCTFLALFSCGNYLSFFANEPFVRFHNSFSDVGSYRWKVRNCSTLLEIYSGNLSIMKFIEMLLDLFLSPSRERGEQTDGVTNLQEKPD